MTTIVEIPGIGEVEFPDSMSRAEIGAAAKRLFGQTQPAPAAVQALPAMPDSGPLRSPLNDPLLGRGISEGAARAAATASPVVAPDVPGTAAFTRGFARRLGDNILATPELIADTVIPRLLPREGAGGMVPDPLELASRGISALTGGRVDPMASADQLRQRVAQGGHVVDLPSTTDLAAGIETAVQAAPGAAKDFGSFLKRPLIGAPPTAPAAPQPGLGERFQQAQTDQMVTDIQMAEAAPFATGAGEVAGDIATLLGGRAALRGGTAQQLAPIAAERAQTILGRAIQSTGAALARAGGRAAESGAEGAFLAALQGADPMQVGGIAAGGQAIGELARPTFLKLIQPKNLFAAIGIATIASLGAQQLTPGGLDRVLPTLEKKNKEAIIALLLTGTVGTLTGRVPKEFAGPAFAELASVMPRGALLSVLSSYSKDSARVGPVLQKFSEDPDYFGPKARRLLERALTTEDVDLSGTINRLMEERPFRQKFGALTAPPAAP